MKHRLPAIVFDFLAAVLVFVAWEKPTFVEAAITVTVKAFAEDGNVVRSATVNGLTYGDAKSNGIGSVSSPNGDGEYVLTLNEGKRLRLQVVLNASYTRTIDDLCGHESQRVSFVIVRNYGSGEPDWNTPDIEELKFFVQCARIPSNRDEQGRLHKSVRDKLSGFADLLSGSAYGDVDVEERNVLLNEIKMELK